MTPDGGETVLVNDRTVLLLDATTRSSFLSAATRTLPAFRLGMPVLLAGRVDAFPVALVAWSPQPDPHEDWAEVHVAIRTSLGLSRDSVAACDALDFLPAHAGLTGLTCDLFVDQVEVFSLVHRIGFRPYGSDGEGTEQRVLLHRPKGDPPSAKPVEPCRTWLPWPEDPRPSYTARPDATTSSDLSAENLDLWRRHPEAMRHIGIPPTATPAELTAAIERNPGFRFRSAGSVFGGHWSICSRIGPSKTLHLLVLDWDHCVRNARSLAGLARTVRSVARPGDLFFSPTAGAVPGSASALLGLRHRGSDPSGLMQRYGVDGGLLDGRGAAPDDHDENRSPTNPSYRPNRA